MEIVLYRKKYPVVIDCVKCDYEPEMVFKLYLTKDSIFHFCLSVPNISFNYRNPLKCMSECIGYLMGRDLKYEVIKGYRWRKS